ncbi:MAG: hypothetical protein K2L04_02605 [Alistipes sp.]|nr:hypothetical protein [Alistipes sp.]
MPYMPVDKYRLTSMEEPTDKMLAQLMKSACAEANKRAAEAERAYFAELSELVEKTRRNWEERRAAQTE